MNFYLPDFYYKYDLNLKLIDLIQEHPEYFYDNIKIGAVYGNFPGAIWNGGRQCLGTTNLDNIKATIQAFNLRDIPLRFTFTNCLLEEKHIYDTYCNIIMEEANNGTNGVIINSKILEEYLRKKFPNYQYILSTTKCERDINVINQLTNEYDMIVTDYRDNSNLDFLSKINQKDKIELLINAYCSPNCQMRQEHYRILSLGQLTFDSIENEKIQNCSTYDRSFLEALNFDSVIKQDSLYTTYKDMGFNNFKIEGRMVNDFNVIESYIYYLVKPEYKDKVRLILLK